MVKELQEEKYKSESEVREAQGLLDKLEWRTSLCADKVVATNFIYMQLLGDEWIPGDIIQLMINCMVLQFNLMRVEIRELRPKVVTEGNKVLVHYQGRTSMTVVIF